MTPEEIEARLAVLRAKEREAMSAHSMILGMIREAEHWLKVALGSGPKESDQEPTE